MKREPPKIVLETTAAIAYLASEPEWPDVETLVALAEAGKIGLLMSEFAWSQIDPEHEHRRDRLERLRNVADHMAKVARVGECRIGSDMLGHDASNEIATRLGRGAGREDTEQFLSFAARADATYFVTKDKNFVKYSMRTGVHERFGFQVGTPRACLDWLRGDGIL
jgi:hypothetical protein